MKRSKPITVWAGFSSGKIHIDTMLDGWGGGSKHKRKIPALFMTRQEAQMQYEDVRKVEIKEVWIETK